VARELRPAALDDLGLAAALRTQVDEFARRAGVRAELRLPSERIDDLPGDDALVVYRVVQESLSNVTRHALAAEVRVDVERPPGGVVVRVRDDGVGFVCGQERGLGLTGMRERAVLARGRLDVASAPGAGTAIELRLGTAA
jgi:two-component system, NarL family, sensor histidine kinase UhpB